MPFDYDCFCKKYTASHLHKSANILYYMTYKYIVTLYYII